ncbi:sulfotransferase domain-containing protein [Pseudodonghicola flavimaris]|uniref:Sulfotransferase domain-containing protein n=1 Tax=Pseudodonghicola flavimaris TaxID=3050036 RepID=A0ABT7EZ40_9RHOB|nr:sulfotransferase domain-containing protein [Pseudodonghicola flavimaris]MDK3017605.1 sulfotransferase domain-containing protein [Pseudodonghicola flavimaris]
MLIITSGAQKSATTAGFQLTSIMAAANYAFSQRIDSEEAFDQVLARRLFRSDKELTAAANEALKSGDATDDAVPVIIKTHGYLQDEVLKKVRVRDVLLVVSVRHPADVALALVDASENERHMENPRFKTYNIEETAASIAWYEKCLIRSLKGSPYIIEYERLFDDPTEIIVGMSNNFGLPVNEDVARSIVERYEENKSMYGEYNKGKPQRRFDELSDTEIRKIEALAPVMTELSKL